MILSEEKKQSIREIMEQTQKAVSDIYGTPVTIMYKIKSNNINPNMLLQIVLAHFKITYSQFVSSKRTTDLVVPRYLYCYLAQGYCGIKQQSIADIICRDRTTVVTGIQKVADMIVTDDKMYTEPLQQIEEAIMNMVKENV